MELFAVHVNYVIAYDFIFISASFIPFTTKIHQFERQLRASLYMITF